MERILVTGLDTVTGGNLAATWASRAQVTGLASRRPVEIVDVDCRGLAPTTADAIESLLAQINPTRLVCVGPAADSCWDIAESRLPGSLADQATLWAAAASRRSIPLTYISSDAVFTGPWLFHREQGTCYCNSHGARLLRAAEAAVTERCPEALILRTHTYGWSPSSSDADPGPLEAMLASLAAGETVGREYFRHATPILATDLADMLPRCWQAELSGLYHLAGAERVNPFRLACLIADEFQLPASLVEPLEVAIDRRKAFGGGETSLQTRRIRKQVDLALPLLREGITRLRDQFDSGYRDRFQPISAAPLLERAA